MTYTAWLNEVDAAFEGKGRRMRVKDMSPAALLLGFEKGLTPEEFATNATAFSFQAENSTGPGGSGAQGFLSDTSCLDTPDRPQASFVVRCLTGMGWFCFGLAVLFLIMAAAALVQTSGVPGGSAEQAVLEGIVSSSSSVSKAASQQMPDLSGAMALSRLSSAFTLFVIGILSWWGSAMLRGLYLVIKVQANSR